MICFWNRVIPSYKTFHSVIQYGVSVRAAGGGRGCTEGKVVHVLTLKRSFFFVCQN